ncbi:hypothetical protein LT493_02160 [Streptomyces tricolor]|nr:hypothetical protein [Streptomyces tricolor]
MRRVTAELDDTTGRLTSVTWPRDFFPGLMLELRWQRGGTVIRLATTRLEEPVQVGDRVIGHCHDPRVLTREDAPGSDRHGDSAAGLGPRQLVMRTVRRRGLLTLDGHAPLDRSVLPTAVYGRRPGRSQAATLESARSPNCSRNGSVGRHSAARDLWGQPHYPAREGSADHPPHRLPPRPATGDTPMGRRGTGRPGAGCRPVHPRSSAPPAAGCSPSEVQRAAFGSTAAGSRQGGRLGTAVRRRSSPSTRAAAETTAPRAGADVPPFCRTSPSPLLGVELSRTPHHRT